MVARTLTTGTPKSKVLAPVHPNEGIIAAYQRKLDAMIAEMNASILYWVKAAYRANEPEALAMDRSPAAELNSAVKKLAKRWQTRFDKASTVMAKQFALSAAGRADASLKAALKKAGFTVDFKMTAAQNDAVQAVIAENVGLIRSISAQYLTDVQGLVMRSVANGYTMGELSKALQDRYGVTRKRAALISRDQTNKATAVVTRVRQRELGIVEARWRHSAGGKHPRASHVAANNKPYKIAKGMKIDGEFIYPGEAINCRCVSIAIIPGIG